MTRDEKEQYVIELYKQGRTIRQIAKLMHMSFGDIGKIINKFKEETERAKGHLDEKNNDYNIKTKSKITQAIQLFLEGKSPVEVVTALDLPADEVRAINREFWELKGMHKLTEIYDHNKYYLSSLLRLHKILNELRMGEEEINNVLKLAKNNEIAYLQDKVEFLRNDIDRLELEKKKWGLDNFATYNTYKEDMTNRRLANFVPYNNHNNYDDGVEVFYAMGTWHNLIPYKMK